MKSSLRNIRNKVAIVTGGASGIGAATVRRLHDEGAQIVIADINDVAGEALAAELGVAYARTDVTSEDSIRALVDYAVKNFGSLDIFFANAAVFGAVGPISLLDTDALDATISVNLRAVILCVKHAARVMGPAESGSIILTASPGALIGGAGPHVYSATKGGVISFARSVAAELRSFGIRVNSVVPGAIVSAMTADAISGDATDLKLAAKRMAETSMLGRAGMPEDIAGAVAFLASDDSLYMTGSEIYVDAGYTHAAGSAAFADSSWAETGGLFEGGRRGRDIPKKD